MACQLAAPSAHLVLEAGRVALLAALRHLHEDRDFLLWLHAFGIAFPASCNLALLAVDALPVALRQFLLLAALLLAALLLGMLLHAFLDTLGMACQLAAPSAHLVLEAGRVALLAALRHLHEDRDFLLWLHAFGIAFPASCNLALLAVDALLVALRQFLLLAALAALLRDLLLAALLLLSMAHLLQLPD